jgi:hypothetical protein
MDKITDYSIQAIELLHAEIRHLGSEPVIQFELEGTYRPHFTGDTALDYKSINQKLRQHGIQGIIKPEYWQFQWEYASEMEGQTPLKAAHDLNWLMKNLPALLHEHGAHEVFIKPVCWGKEGEHQPLLEKDSEKFDLSKNVHVPNAIQINISATNRQGINALPDCNLGEWLQYHLLETSYECCLLYSPEKEAFSRLSLKQDYGLHEELSSPCDLSGGYQGSIALYKERGKHNQFLGEYDSIKGIYHWQPHSRVEHRLGASSKNYNAYLNCAYALANLSDALVSLQEKRTAPHFGSKKLPNSFKQAYEIFAQGEWFEGRFNRLSNASNQLCLGTLLKSEVLKGLATMQLNVVKG